MALQSLAGNLVPGQSSFAEQVFVYDRDTGSLALASHKTGSATTGWWTWWVTSSKARFLQDRALFS